MSVVTFEREAVHRSTVLEPHADRGDLAWDDGRIGMVDVEPDPGEAGQSTGVRQPQFAERVDQQALDPADVVGRPEPVVDVEDRVADELAGAVVGDVAAALHGDQLGADRGRLALQVVREVAACART